MTTDRTVTRRRYVASAMAAGSLGVAGCSAAESIEEVEVSLSYPDELIAGIENVFVAEVAIAESDLLDLGDHELHDPFVEVVIEDGDAEITHVMPGDFAKEVDSGRNYVAGHGVDSPWEEGDVKVAAVAVRPETPGSIEVSVYANGHGGDGDVESLEVTRTVDVVGDPEATLSAADLVGLAETRAELARAYRELLDRSTLADVDERLRDASLTLVASGTHLAAGATVGKIAGVSDLADYLWETLELFSSPFDYLLGTVVPDEPDEADVDVETFGPPFFSQFLAHADSAMDIDALFSAADRRRAIIMLDVAAEYADEEADLWTQLAAGEGIDEERMHHLLAGQITLLDESEYVDLYDPTELQADLDRAAEGVATTPAETPDAGDKITEFLEIQEAATDDPAERNTLRSMRATVSGQRTQIERYQSVWFDGELVEQETAEQERDEDATAEAIVDARTELQAALALLLQAVEEDETQLDGNAFEAHLDAATDALDAADDDATDEQATEIGALRDLIEIVSLRGAAQLTSDAGFEDHMRDGVAEYWAGREHFEADLVTPALVDAMKAFERADEDFLTAVDRFRTAGELAGEASQLLEELEAETVDRFDGVTYDDAREDLTTFTELTAAFETYADGLATGCRAWQQVAAGYIELLDGDWSDAADTFESASSTFSSAAAAVDEVAVGELAFLREYTAEIHCEIEVGSDAAGHWVDAATAAQHDDMETYEWELAAGWERFATCHE